MGRNRGRQVGVSIWRGRQVGMGLGRQVGRARVLMATISSSWTAIAPTPLPSTAPAPAPQALPSTPSAPSQGSWWPASGRSGVGERRWCAANLRSSMQTFGSCLAGLMHFVLAFPCAHCRTISTARPAGQGQTSSSCAPLIHPHLRVQLLAQQDHAQLKVVLRSGQARGDTDYAMLSYGAPSSPAVCPECLLLS